MPATADDWDWWFGIWKGLINCGACGALMYTNAPCPVCGQDYRNVPPQRMEFNGEVIEVQPAFAGAVNWSDYVLLRLMHQEWQRPAAMPDNFAGMPDERRPASRLLTVILSWSLFESLMGRLLEAGMRTLPASVNKDLLTRYSSVGSRMDRLYRIIFDSTLEADLKRLEYPQLWAHLREVQKRRNAFIHGEPEAINDELANKTAEYLPVLQEAWMRLYNLRCARLRGV